MFASPFRLAARCVFFLGSDNGLAAPLSSIFELEIAVHPYVRSPLARFQH